MIVFNTKLNTFLGKAERSIFFNLFLIVCVSLVFYPLLNNEFLNSWDDQWVVVNTYTEGGFRFQNLKAIFLETYNTQYAPFNELLYLSLYQLFGYDPYVFHFASILIHIINVLLVYRVSTELILRIDRNDRRKAHACGFLIALFFGIHPFNVEAVAWISASKILVYATFYLLATYTIIIFMERREVKHYLLTVILFVFSFFGKEQAVIFPIWMILLWCCLGNSLKNKKIWFYITPFLILSLVFGILTMFAQSKLGYGVLSKEEDYPFWQRIFLGSYAYVDYLAKSLIPTKLFYLYPFPSPKGKPLPDWILLCPLAIVTVCLICWKLIKQPVLLFGLLFFSIHIAIALHIIPLSRHAIIADRYAYVSTIGIGLIIVYYAYSLIYGNINKFIKPVVVLSLFSLLIYFAVYSHQRTYQWHDSESIKWQAK
jgi:hypothetical protein